MSSISNKSQISSVIANASDLPTKEPEYPLSMGDEHLSSILKTELDEVIKSSVKNLVQILSECEVTSDNDSEFDVPVNDESSPIFTTFSNTLFDCNDDFNFSDDKLLSNEDVPKENFRIYSNHLFDNEIISKISSTILAVKTPISGSKSEKSQHSVVPEEDEEMTDYHDDQI
nr:hypothetical protein [Tanacetum cinerariifolium]